MTETTQIQLEVERTKRQKMAWKALDDPKIRRVLYGGAKGGGKSYFLCVWAFTEAYKIIVANKLRPTKNPIHVGWLGRKQATDFTATTLQTWRKIIPEEYYEIKGGTEKDPKHLLIMNRVAIDYGGLDRQETINKFNSAEYAFFGIDQAEETNRDDVSVIQGSLRLKINGKESPVFGMSNNPTNWSETLSPGEEAELIAIFDPTHHGPEGTGLITRTISIKSNDTIDALKEVQFEADVVK